MKKRQTLYTCATVLCVFLLTGTSAVRADVPSWFWSALFNWADGVTAEVEAVDARVAALEAQVASMDAYIQQLQAYVEVDETTDPARPTVRVVAANLQVINGLGETSTLNSVGNIIIGYNEDAGGPQPQQFCSSFIYENSSDCINGGFIWASSQKSGSHNLVMGITNAYSSYGSIISGELNMVNAQDAAVIGGIYNRGSGTGAVLAGGEENIVTFAGFGSFIGGGVNHLASSRNAGMLGGNSNIADGYEAALIGGSLNTVNTNGGATISGGTQNIADGLSSSIGGGSGNHTGSLADYSSISGGQNNFASGSYSSISGGANNAANGEQSSILGGFSNIANGQFSTVSGGLLRTAPGPADWVAGALFQDF